MGVGTPLAVYGVVFWDHAPVAVLSSGGLLLLARGAQAGSDRTIFWGGVLVGAATWFRNEAYLFAAAAVGAWTLAVGRKHLGSLVAGLACGAAPAWALNWQLYGHALGLKGLAAVEAAHSRLGGEGWLWDRALVAYDALVSTEDFVNARSPTRVFASLAISVVWVTSAMLLALGTRSGNAVSIVCAGVGVAGTSLWLWASRWEIMGLLPAVPALVVLSLWKPHDRWERLTGWVAGLYVLGVLAVGSTGGLQWGPRYLLPVVPPLV